MSEPRLESPHVVYKYRLKPAENLIEMPTGARLLHVDSQGSRAYVWALVNSKERAVRRKIAVVLTGLDFTTDCPIEHVGTFKIVEPDGGLGTMIFHAFDCGERENDAPTPPKGEA